ncbi:hypothetical protein [Bacillus alkalisoli]|uniref:hypothetical protein n=1 Tax=Bacillus alkalisoli TaxID=2011008 RepID=UPI000C23918A|nr:hypothetical protein [Bacillus alkalisoli]
MRRNLDEEQLEEMLNKMPKLKDHRTSQQIYQNIRHKVEQPKRRLNFFPAAAIVAAIMLLALVTPSLLNNMNFGLSGGSNESTIEMAGYDHAATSDDDAVGSDDTVDFKTLDVDPAKEKMADEFRGEGENSFEGFANYYTISEWDYDKETEYVVTIGVTDNNAQLSLPLSFIVPKDGKTYVEKFNEMRKLVAYHVDFHVLGVSTILNDDFNYSEVQTPDGKKRLVVEGLNKHGSYASAQSTSFFNELAISFTWKGYNEIEYVKEGKNDLDIGGTGPLASMQMDNAPRKAYFRYQHSPESPNLLIRSNRVYETIEDAIKIMQTGPDIPLDNGHASIPENMSVKVIDSIGSVVTIEISLSTPLEFNEKDMFAIEAIKMTAKEFGFQTIRFQSDKLDRIGSIQLNTELPTPIAANRMKWE